MFQKMDGAAGKIRAMRRGLGQHLLPETRSSWNGCGLRLLFLIWAAFACSANGTGARQDAQDILARNVLRTCFTALETLQFEQPDRLHVLDGRSCQEVPGLGFPGLDARNFPASRITLHPEAQEGVQVRVTSSTGKSFVAPRTLTPRPASGSGEAVTPWPRWATMTLCVLTFGLVVTLLSLIPTMSLLAWAAGPLLLLGGWFLWTVSGYGPTDDGPAMTVGLLIWNTWAWLLLGMGTTVLRRVRHAGHESWAASLGAGLLWAIPLSPTLTFTALPALSGDDGFLSGLAVMLLLCVLLFTLIAWGQRFFTAGQHGDS